MKSISFCPQGKYLIIHGPADSKAYNVHLCNDFSYSNPPPISLTSHEACLVNTKTLISRFRYISWLMTYITLNYQNYSFSNYNLLSPGAQICVITRDGGYGEVWNIEDNDASFLQILNCAGLTKNRKKALINSNLAEWSHTGFKFLTSCDGFIKIWNSELSALNINSSKRYSILSLLFSLLLLKECLELTFECYIIFIRKYLFLIDGFLHLLWKRNILI